MIKLIKLNDNRVTILKFHSYVKLASLIRKLSSPKKKHVKFVLNLSLVKKKRVLNSFIIRMLSSPNLQNGLKCPTRF